MRKLAEAPARLTLNVLHCNNDPHFNSWIRNGFNLDFIAFQISCLANFFGNLVTESNSVNWLRMRRLPGSTGD